MKKFEVGTVGFSLDRVEIRPGKPKKMWRLSIDETGYIFPDRNNGGETAEAIEQHMRVRFENQDSNVARFRDMFELPISERDPAVTDADYLRASQILQKNPGLKIYCTSSHGRIFLLTKEMRGGGAPEIYLGAAPAEIMNTPYHLQKAALVQHVHTRAAQINQMTEADGETGNETPSCDRPAP